MVLVFTTARIFFFLFNKTQFTGASFFDFILGFWFDCITTAIVFLPLLVVEIIPQFWRTKKWHFQLLKITYFLLLTPTLLINIADIEYFKFTSTRSNFSTFKMLSYGSDFTNQIPSFIRDYWYLLILLIVLLFTANWVYNKLVKTVTSESKWTTQIIMFVLISATIISIGRGWGLRPISPIRASQYTADQNAPLVLNSTFTILKSAGKKTLTTKNYHDSTTIVNWFNPIKQYRVKQHKKQPNIVIIMLESFSVEYISAINGDSLAYTPFLDSLIHESLVFNNCFANGKKSIDAVPSVISSIPKLMPAEFITSTYSTNQIESLPSALKKMNYSSSFYHGATNGSMNFDGFAAKVKFDHYEGRNEYANDEHFDGTWGIYDHLFLPWSVNKMSQLKKPFLGTIFTLSSHPPYSIPLQLQPQFNEGPTKMHDAVKYSDFALKQFFAAAKRTDWYQNTLFVITADHTPASSNPLYFNERGVMSIPLVLFHPNDKKFTGQSNKIVGQIDIMPTILEYVGYTDPFYSFGESVFSTKAGFTVTELRGKYLVYGEGYFMVFQNGKVTRMYQINDKTLNHTLIKSKPELVKLLKNKLLAYIQTYHNGMINNNLKAK
ncbi:MAG: LTA synthase family protein [Crocinitomicaceae bacterium]